MYHTSLIIIIGARAGIIAVIIVIPIIMVIAIIMIVIFVCWLKKRIQNHTEARYVRINSTYACIISI